MSTEARLNRLAEALWSANEVDRNMEEANVVDGLFAIARAGDRIAGAGENIAKALGSLADTVSKVDEGTSIVGAVHDAIDAALKIAGLDS